MQTINLSPFPHHTGVVVDTKGDEILLVVVKATFVVEKGHLRIAEKQRPVVAADRYHADPATSSLLAAADLAPVKPAADVVLTGHAYAMSDGDREVEVTLKAGTIDKRVRVFGDRNWEKRTVGGYRLSDPGAVHGVPLVWERAFGGTDRSDPDRPTSEARNPVGVGFRGPGAKAHEDPVAVANLENPERPLRSPEDRPDPIGFGFVAPSWQPRVGLAGTYDDRWERERAPLLPLDFSTSFFQTAPADQIIAEGLPDGMPVEVTHASPGGKLAFELPTVTPLVAAKFLEERLEFPLRRDTLVIDGDRESIEITWRGRVSLHGRIYQAQWAKIWTTGGVTS